MPANICDCGRFIEQPRTGRRRDKCKVCRPPQRRARNQTAPVIGLPAPAPGPDGASGPSRRSLAAATLADLSRVDRADTTDGIAALHLAELIDAGGYNAAGAAALVKAHREALVVALEGTAPTADVIDAIFGAG